MGRSVPSRQDLLALEAIQEGRIRVDADKGECWRGDRRAEIPNRRSGYGQVYVSNRPLTLAMAHRMVWIAVYGLIPHGLQVNHRNGHRWDNRIGNLELVTPAGNQRHAHTLAYDAVGGNVDAEWPGRLDRGEQFVREDRTTDLMRVEVRADFEPVWSRFR